MPVPIAYAVLRPHELLGRLLELPLMRWLGKLSYSLYVWQMLFFTNEARYLGEIQDFPLAFLATALCAVGCHYVIEKPAIRIGRRLAGRKLVADQNAATLHDGELGNEQAGKRVTAGNPRVELR